MNLIERYIHEVGRRLPRHMNRQKRADIQVELRSLLLDSLEADGGSQASEERVVEVLKEFGAPKQVAASYQAGEQHLIGPQLFPLYRMVVGIVLAALTGALLLAVGIGALASGATVSVPEPLAALDFIAELIGSLISAFGMVTLVFAILQYFGVRPEMEDEPWEPRSLPPVAEESDQVGRAGTIFELAASLVILAILWFAPGLIGVVTSPGQPILTNPVIVQYIPLISISLLAGMALNLVMLWQGRWTTATRIAKIGANLLSVFVLYTLFMGHSAWLAAHGLGGFFATLESLSDGDATQAQWALMFGMQAFRLAFGVALIVVSLETVSELYKLARRTFIKPLTITPAPEA